MEATWCDLNRGRKWSNRMSTLFRWIKKNNDKSSLMVRFSTYLQLRLGHLATPLQVQGCESIPDGFEQLRAQVHVYSTVWFPPLRLFFFFPSAVDSGPLGDKLTPTLCCCCQADAGLYQTGVSGDTCRAHIVTDTEGRFRGCPLQVKLLLHGFLHE